MRYLKNSTILKLKASSQQDVKHYEAVLMSAQAITDNINSLFADDGSSKLSVNKKQLGNSGVYAEADGSRINCTIQGRHSLRLMCHRNSKRSVIDAAIRDIKLAKYNLETAHLRADNIDARAMQLNALLDKTIELWRVAGINDTECEVMLDVIQLELCVD